jgi:hypothetical protein
MKILDTTNINTETLLDAGKEVGPKVNAKKTKNMLMCCHQNP